jgi:hypothetical protein
MAPDWVHMPLTIWYNGGPGAPSTYGLFQEFGPFLLTEESYLTPGALRASLRGGPTASTLTLPLPLTITRVQGDRRADARLQPVDLGERELAV